MTAEEQAALEEKKRKEEEEARRREEEEAAARAAQLLAAATKGVAREEQINRSAMARKLRGKVFTVVGANRYEQNR